MKKLVRRETLRFLVALPLLLQTRTANSSKLPKVTLTKDPNCGCCNGWAAHLRGSGFDVEIIESTSLDALKAQLGVPPALASCHTAELGAYVLEGHVPDVAIRKLLAERPQAKGLAVPGMPIGSPGMEMEGMAAEEYTVFVFDEAGHRPYARFIGKQELQG
jgi:hypothetical protein